VEVELIGPCPKFAIAAACLTLLMAGAAPSTLAQTQQQLDASHTAATVGSAHAEPVILTCLETHYDQTSNPNLIPHYVVFEKAGEASSAHLRMDDKPPDMTVVEISETKIQARVNETDLMPVPSKIDACLAQAIKASSGVHALGVPSSDVIMFIVLDCQHRARLSTNPVPIILDVTINRITGAFKVIRSQDKTPAHSTQNYGTCTVTTPKF
jgi:hypothetical protein